MIRNKLNVLTPPTTTLTELQQEEGNQIPPDGSAGSGGGGVSCSRTIRMSVVTSEVVWFEQKKGVNPYSASGVCLR